MQIIINGEGKILAENMSLAHLVEQTGINANKAAIEVNCHIIPRSLYAETMLSEGDRIEIVQFIGGG